MNKVSSFFLEDALSSILKETHMKKISKFLFLTLFAMILAFVSCTKENQDVRLDPKLSTSEVYNVTADSATVVGFVVAGNDGVTERGICYGTTTAPTTANSKVVYTGSTNTATFVVVLSGLDYATTYYARAYAINASGTLYGEEYTFTTLPVIPTLTTTLVTAIAGTSAVSGGNITVTGGADITARGVCWSKDPNPTVDNSKTVDGEGAGEFTSNMTGLEGLTKYYVRAYATNSAGTAYGEELEFTTLVSIRNWYIPGDYVEASYPGSGLSNWSPANSPMVKSNEANPDNVEGYVYMANADNQWKFATQPNWDGPNYGGTFAASGILDPSGDNFHAPAGFYKLNANPTAMTFTAIATNWGVIGDATPGGWGDETALTYVPETKLWSGGLHLTANSFKFRANHNWDFNYGSTDKLNLVAGGDNIPVAVEADYFVKLDLSHPLEYTYSAHCWGLIGSATPDGWNSDQNLTWDGTALTITLDLVVGEIKFRADDDWGLNYGGDINALNEGGANIPINAAGNYTIRLFLSGVTPYCTITMN